MSDVKPAPARRALSVQETAEAVGISRATVYRLIGRKKLATVKIGARTVIPVSEIDTLLSRATSAA